jgi:hypothetical protein
MRSGLTIRASRAARWLLGVLACASAPAIADQPELVPGHASPDVEITAATTDVGDTELSIRGNWPTPCLPQIEHVSRIDREITIEARSRRGLCARVPKAFALTANLTEWLGRPLDAGAYQVRFLAANGTQDDVELRGFDLVEIGPGTPLVPETGFWFPERNAVGEADAHGTSVSIELQGDTVAIAVLGYADDGAAAWYFGTGQLRGSTARVDLVGMRDGASLMRDGAESAIASDSLTLDIEFLGNARAQAWFSRYEHGVVQPRLSLRRIALVRLPLATATEPAAWQGEWMLQATAPGVAPAAAQPFVFDNPYRVDAGQFRLSDASGYVLQCLVSAARPQSPPDQCALLDGTGAAIARFTAVGINRLDGTDSRGGRVQLVRVQKR